MWQSQHHNPPVEHVGCGSGFYTRGSHEVTVTEAVPAWSSPQTFGQVKAGVWQYLETETHGSWSCLDAWCLCQLMGDTCWHWISTLHRHAEQYWLIINALLLAGNTKITSLCCLSILTLHVLLFSLIYCCWGEDWLVSLGTECVFKTPILQRADSNFTFPQPQAEETRKKILPQFYSTESWCFKAGKAPKKMGDAEVTQGEGFSPLLLCLRG